MHVYKFVTIGIFRNVETRKILFKDFVPAGHFFCLGQTYPLETGTDLEEEKRAGLIPDISVISRLSVFSPLLF